MHAVYTLKTRQYTFLSSLGFLFVQIREGSKWEVITHPLRHFYPGILYKNTIFMNFLTHTQIEQDDENEIYFSCFFLLPVCIFFKIPYSWVFFDKDPTSHPYIPFTFPLFNSPFPCKHDGDEWHRSKNWGAHYTKNICRKEDEHAPSFIEGGFACFYCSFFSLEFARSTWSKMIIRERKKCRRKI